MIGGIVFYKHILVRFYISRPLSRSNDVQESKQ